MKFEEENRELKQKLEKIKKEFEDTKRDLEETKKEFEEFKSKHAQTVFELRKALKIKPNLHTPTRHVGAQQGHKAYVRHVP